MSVDAVITQIATSLRSDNPKYSDCLSAVDKNLKVLRTTAVSRQARMELKEALESLSNLNQEKAKFSAKPFPRLSEFLDRLGQLFCLHGFRTKREYGLHLVDQINGFEKNIWRQELKNYLEGKESWDFEKMIAGIKDLPKDKFIEFIKIYIDTPAAAVVDGHKKLAIFARLTKEQKEALKTFRENESWYISVFKMLKGASQEQMDEFITEQRIKTFANQPNAFLFAWSDQRARDQSFDLLAERVIVHGFRKYLNDGTEQSMFWVNWLLRDKEFGHAIKDILEKNLTEQEKKQLNRFQGMPS